MAQNTPNKFTLGKISALLLLVSGGLFAAFALAFGAGTYPNLVTATFLDSVAVPFQEFTIGEIQIPIELDNFLVFQEFKAIVPESHSAESFLFGGIFFLIVVSALTSFSYFQKFPFLGVGLVWIVLLTLSNINGLNIGGLSANLSLIILIVGSLAPVVLFHVWKTEVQFFWRWIVVFGFLLASVFTLIFLSPIDNPALYLAEQAVVPAIGFAMAWLFWQGHGLVSGIFVLLSKANQNLNTKISIQVTLLAVVYFLILIGLLLGLKGEVNLPFPIFSALYLILPIGVLGWFSTREKLLQESNLAAGPAVLKALFILGFSTICWLIWKLEVTANQPAKEMLKHLLVYSQMAFSLFFIIYLMSNFLSVMNTGKAIHKILFKPYSLPYYHLRIGGIIGMLVITIYMEAVVAAQFNSLTTNILGDYYLETGKKLEASILYENSWNQYRYNPKAKFLTANLLFELNQPTLAKEHLEQSFSEAPQVDNILLLCERLNRENKLFEVIYYLENGLKFFPENPRLLNNLALYYTLTQQYDKAEILLKENAGNNPVTASNWIALQAKLGLKSDGNESAEDLISRINLLALQRKSGVAPENQFLQKIRSELPGSASAMVQNAAWRNLVTQTNVQDPTEELIYLDTLAKSESMQDYIMQLQETGSLRSLAAGRVMEAVKNLNGLAFRNPGDAAYYLQLTAKIQALNLDFEKASKDLRVAEEKGFAAFTPSHLAILRLGGLPEEAQRISAKYQVPNFEIAVEDSVILSNFTKFLPEKAFDIWDKLSSETLKTQLALPLLAQKSHGLTKYQLGELGKHLKNSPGFENLEIFLSNPDWANKESLSAFTKFLGQGEELTGNPYYTPLILSAADRIPDPLAQYEIINAASDFNKDPLLWMRKVEAAKRIGLDNYATAAIEEMSTWMTWDEIEKLQRANY